MIQRSVPESGVPTGLRHMLYPYSGEQQYLTGTLAYIDHARTGGGSIVVAAPEPRRQFLREHLPDDGTVSFVDTDALGRNPGRLIPAWQDWIGRCAHNGPVHGINESVWSGRTRSHQSELRYHEWLLNLAFASAPAWSLMCPYDTAGQPAATVEALSRCHPLVWNGTAHVPGSDYDPGPYRFDPLAEPSEPYEQMPYASGDLHALRTKVSRYAIATGLSPQRVRDMLLAVTEIATNSIRHGGGSGTLQLWAVEGALVCELRDSGYIDDPLAGRVRPAPNQLGGRGLWFVHQTCDLVEIRSTRQDGTRVRLHMYLDA